MNLAESEIAAKADSAMASESTSFGAVCHSSKSTSGGGGVAASTLAPSAVVYSFNSLLRELRGVASPPADVVNLGQWQENVKQFGFVGESHNYVLQDDFKEFDSRLHMPLLAAKLLSSPNVKVLNLSGIDMRDCFWFDEKGNYSRMGDVTQALGKLTALQEINLCYCSINHCAGMLVESLGKLTALRKLDLSGAV